MKISTKVAVDWGDLSSDPSTSQSSPDLPLLYDDIGRLMVFKLVDDEFIQMDWRFAADVVTKELIIGPYLLRTKDILTAGNDDVLLRIKSKKFVHIVSFLDVYLAPLLQLGFTSTDLFNNTIGLNFALINYYKVFWSHNGNRNDPLFGLDVSNDIERQRQDPVVKSRTHS